MSEKEIKEAIERLETQLFYESMSDFVDWDRYEEMKKRIDELKEMLEND